MPTTVEYAIMAGRAYLSTRGLENRFPVPLGWAQTNHVLDNVTGFEAVALQNGSNEIVISFTGTTPGAADGVYGNLPTGLGFISSQLKQAAAFYQQIMRDNPGTAIIGMQALHRRHRQ